MYPTPGSLFNDPRQILGNVVFRNINMPSAYADLPAGRMLAVSNGRGGGCGPSGCQLESGITTLFYSIMAI